jgi:L-lactate dehydrogenase complex protein LldG
MTAAREEILGKISRALKSEARTGAPRANSVSSSSDDARLALEVRRRCDVERQSLLERFELELKNIGVRIHSAATIHSAAGYVEQLVSERGAKTVVASSDDVVESLSLATILERHKVRYVTEAVDSEFHSIASEAGIGVSGIDYALADTGTLVLLTGKGRARSISLLPPVHIAIAKPDQIVSDIDDLFALVRFDRNNKQLASAVTFITGPSRTADIELTLVIGVHGPQELHVVIVED